MRLTLPTYASFALAVLAPLAAGQTYQVVDLDPAGTLTDETSVRALGENTYLGSATQTSTGIKSARVYLPNGTTQSLPYLPGDTFGDAVDRNASGLVIGYSKRDNPNFPFNDFEEAVVWNAGVPTKIESLIAGVPAYDVVALHRINSAGEIVGSATQLSSGTGRAFRLSNGILTDLGTLAAGDSGTAMASSINDVGQIVGSATSPTGWAHAFRYQNGIKQDLHDPSVLLGVLSGANDIDRFGRACGFGSTGVPSNFTTRAIAWTTDGAAIDLGGFPFALSARAQAMNDLDDIVGSSDGAPGPVSTHALLWSNGVMHDLNSLIPSSPTFVLSSALDIDNDGNIVALGFDSSVPAYRYVLLQPVCNGGSANYGSGCAGTAGVVPTIRTQNCPTPGNTFALRIQNGRPNAPALLVLGTGTGSIPIVPSCALQVLPMLGSPVAFPLDAAGEQFLPVNVPSNTPSLSVSMQLLCVDPAGNGGLSSSAPLLVQIQ